MTLTAPQVWCPTWDELETRARQTAARWHGAGLTAVYGVPRGGIVPAVMVAKHLGVTMADELVPNVLVIDDLVDSGATARRYNGAPFDALYRKSWSPPGIASRAMAVPGDSWVSFPWEAGETPAADAVVRLLEHVGENPTRSGLVDTPERVLRALAEMTAGYRDDPAAILSKVFPDSYDEMVVVRGVDFTSLCEHHLLAFTGTATVAYIPQEDRGVVGLSKLARLVECFARRLQVQERLTCQIADALEEHLQPRGVGVVVSARHSCMGCRGVRKPGAVMVTSRLRGLMKEDPAARAEFLALARSAG